MMIHWAVPRRGPELAESVARPVTVEKAIVGALSAAIVEGPNVVRRRLATGEVRPHPGPLPQERETAIRAASEFWCRWTFAGVIG